MISMRPQTRQHWNPSGRQIFYQVDNQTPCFQVPRDYTVSISRASATKSISDITNFTIPCPESGRQAKDHKDRFPVEFWIL